jgi:hypothetical protein
LSERICRAIPRHECPLPVGQRPAARSSVPEGDSGSSYHSESHPYNDGEKTMGSKMTEPDLTLYRIVDEILYYLWDPIGVANSAGPRDEYRMYVPKVFELVILADGPTLLAYLLSVERDGMGLAGNSASAQQIAELLLAWRAKLSEASLS